MKNWAIWNKKWHLGVTSFFILFLLFIPFGCESTPKKVAHQEGIPKPGKWTKLVLNQNISNLLVFYKELFENRGWHFGTTFQARPSYEGNIDYDPYFYVLYYPKKKERFFKKNFPSLENFRPQNLEDFHWENLKTLFFNMQILEGLALAIMDRYKLREGSSPWRDQEKVLEISAGFLQMASQDSYLKWLRKYLITLQKSLIQSQDIENIPKGDKEELAWIELNYFSKIQTHPSIKKALVLKRRNRWLIKGQKNFDQILEEWKEMVQKVKSQIFFSKTKWEVRTLYTTGAPSYRETREGKRYNSIIHLALDANGALYFSDFSNIYRLGLRGKKEIVVEGSRNFFHPNIFAIDQFGYLYLMDPPFMRKIKLKKRKIKNYSLEKISKNLKEFSYLGLYPFT
ncbi:MAG: hypothetical protein D6785_06480, partial [Planctomycetota bacterium]